MQIHAKHSVTNFAPIQSIQLIYNINAFLQHLNVIFLSLFIYAFLEKQVLNYLIVALFLQLGGPASSEKSDYSMWVDIN